PVWGAEQAAKSSAAPQTRQRQQHGERLPPLGRSQQGTAQTQGWGGRSRPLHT
ncbi:hypothetical protein KUDE01_011032, partial [Dissostichus eleginoides]